MKHHKSSVRDKALEMRRAAQILLERAAELEAVATSRGPHSERDALTVEPTRRCERERRGRLVDTAVKKFAAVPPHNSSAYPRPHRAKQRLYR